jgi:hypothetical protein
MGWQVRKSRPSELPAPDGYVVSVRYKAEGRVYFEGLKEPIVTINPVTGDEEVRGGPITARIILERPNFGNRLDERPVGLSKFRESWYTHGTASLADSHRQSHPMIKKLNCAAPYSPHGTQYGKDTRGAVLGLSVALAGYSAAFHHEAPPDDGYVSPRAKQLLRRRAFGK